MNWTRRLRDWLSPPPLRIGDLCEPRRSRDGIVEELAGSEWSRLRVPVVPAAGCVGSAEIPLNGDGCFVRILEPMADGRVYVEVITAATGETRYRILVPARYLRLLRRIDEAAWCESVARRLDAEAATAHRLQEIAKG